MTDDAGLKLLAAVEALMAEVRGLRADLASRDGNVTQEMEDLREQAAQLAVLRQGNRDRAKRCRAKSRDCNVTEANSAKLQEVPSRTRNVTSQVVKALDLDQEQKKELLLTSVTSHNVSNVTKPQTAPVWLAYSTAYEARYQAKPVRNAKVNGQLTQLVRRLGDNAAEVAAFYVGHAGAYYGQRGHCVDALLRDAEKLHTEWETGKQITGTQARQQERTAANAEGWTSLLKEPKNGVG